MKTFFAILASVLLLTSCATPYGDLNSSILGGFHSEPAPGNLVKVYFSGNGYTKTEVAQEYAVRYAAELAQKNNLPYFAMYASLGDASMNRKIQVPVVYTEDVGPNAYFYVAFHSKKEKGDISQVEILNRYKKAK